MNSVEYRVASALRKLEVPPEIVGAEYFNMLVCYCSSQQEGKQVHPTMTSYAEKLAASIADHLEMEAGTFPKELPKLLLQARREIESCPTVLQSWVVPRL